MKASKNKTKESKTKQARERKKRKKTNLNKEANNCDKAALDVYISNFLEVYSKW